MGKTWNVFFVKVRIHGECSVLCRRGSSVHRIWQKSVGHDNIPATWGISAGVFLVFLLATHSYYATHLQHPWKSPKHNMKAQNFKCLRVYLKRWFFFFPSPTKKTTHRKLTIPSSLNTSSSYFLCPQSIQISKDKCQFVWHRHNFKALCFCISDSVKMQVSVLTSGKNRCLFQMHRL